MLTPYASHPEIGYTAASCCPNDPETMRRAPSPAHSTAPLRPVIIQGQALSPEAAAAYALQLAQAGQIDTAGDICLTILETHPRHASTAALLGALYCSTGHPQQGRPWLDLAAKQAPEQLDILLDRAACLKACGDLKATEHACRKLLERWPNTVRAQLLLAFVYLASQREAQARALYQHILEQQPKEAEAWNCLGGLYEKAGELALAEHAFRQATSHAPDYPEAWANLGYILTLTAQHQAGLEAYQTALQLRPRYLSAWQGLLFASTYSDQTPASITALHQQFAQEFEAPLPQPFALERAQHPERPLRIGLVSGDLRQHPVGYFTETLVNHLDRQQFELHAFATQTEEDALTRRLRSRFTRWHDCNRLSDMELAQHIHAQQIDILLDLAGHTRGSHLLTFALKPAPIQASWLGYFATTGLKHMDYIIGNSTLLPASEAQLYSEQPCLLPTSHLCYTPPANAPEVSPPPAQQNGWITYGCFNKLTKYNDTLLNTWAAILEQKHNSRLYLQAPEFDDPATQERIRSWLQQHSLPLERVELHGKMPHTDYLAAHAQVDILLDPFPYNGGTTTMDALWMGVPVVTLHGDRYVAHMTEAILLQAGLGDWVAQDRKDYIRLACDWASPEKLGPLRAQMRSKLHASPLLDAPSFGAHFGHTLRQLWENHR